MIDIHALLKAMVEKNASDLHIRVGSPPIFRINGTLFRLKSDPLSVADLDKILKDLLTDDQLRMYQQRNELDMAKGERGVGRFRINIFRQRGTPSLAIRAIRTDVPHFEELNVPDVILDIAMKKRGLILVTGTTGSGKSTLLASMIDHINDTAAMNIVTIEDPIEYLYRDKRSIVVQRELGADTDGFQTALRSCFRQDPDVILIGEIRDKTTMEIGLSAADTGHLVMSTLHTMNTVETITRIVSFFPPHQHDQIRLVLSNVLVAVISLRLLPRKDGAGRVPAAEILINNATVAEYILNQEKTHLIMGAVAEGYTQYGSQTFDQSLLQLYKDDMVSFQTAKQHANNPDDFELKVKGVEGTSDRSWLT
ncbi:MAG: PilT/PilU family type 4a pilus ATPase [Chitinivibrionales bacterium]|nr:PilT/PilU family type 4a pilus ATPase [Chitinivibrionales bacterium]